MGFGYSIPLWASVSGGGCGGLMLTGKSIQKKKRVKGLIHGVRQRPHRLGLCHLMVDGSLPSSRTSTFE